MSRDQSGYAVRAFGKLFVASLVIVAVLWGVRAVTEGAPYDDAKIIAAVALVVLTVLTFRKVLLRFEGSMAKDDSSGS